MNTAERDLIHRELDGENSAEDSRRLQALLSDSSEARLLFEDIARLDAHMKAAELVEPPVWLKGSIMDALPERNRGSSLSGVRDFLRDLLESMQARPALAYSYTFVIGLAVGLALFAVALRDAPASQERVYGTLADREVLEQLAPSATASIQQPGVAGTADVLTSSNLLVVDIELEVEESAVLRLVPGASLELRSITRKSGPASERLEVRSDAVELDIAGRQSYSVLFDRTSEENAGIRLEIYRDDQLLQEVYLQGG